MKNEKEKKQVMYKIAESLYHTSEYTVLYICTLLTWIKNIIKRRKNFKKTIDFVFALDLENWKDVIVPAQLFIQGINAKYKVTEKLENYLVWVVCMNSYR